MERVSRTSKRRTERPLAVAVAIVLAVVSVTVAPPRSATADTATASSTDGPTRAAAQAAGTGGYWLLAADGEVYGFGDATDHGDALGSTTAFGYADLLPSPTGEGYWILTGFGSLWARGDAPELPHPSAQRLPEERFTTGAVTPSGRGVWAFTDTGRVVTVGDAVHYGDMSAFTLDGPVVASAPTPTGRGYYMIGSDGGVFTFGDAVFRGSVRGVLGGRFPDAPVVGVVPTIDNMGYWLVGGDGGVFSFGAPFRGSIPGVLPGVALDAPINGMVAYGNGYLMVASDGGVFNFSDLDFLGSLGGQDIPAPIVSLEPMPRVPTTHAVIGAQGGQVSISDGSAGPGITLTIPPGAVDAGTTITMTRVAQPHRSFIEAVDAGGAIYGGMVDLAAKAGFDSTFFPVVLANNAKPAGPMVILGPPGTSFDSPVELFVPVDQLDLDGDVLPIVLVQDHDGRWESVPATLSADGLRAELEHFSLAALFGHLWSAKDNILKNGLPGVSTQQYRTALNTLDQGPLDDVIDRLLEVPCGRDDLRFNDGVRPDMFGLLQSLGYAGSVGATFGPAEQAALEAHISASFDPNTKGPIGGTPMTLAEVMETALDLTNGDLWQALLMVHNSLRAKQKSVSIQNVLEDVRGDVDAKGKPIDEVGGRYHLFGMATYAFMYEWAERAGELAWNGFSPETAAVVEESWVSGDIWTDTVEYALDRRGADVGRDLFNMWMAASGRGTAAQRDYYAAVCGTEPPGPLRVSLVGVPAQAGVDVDFSLRVDIEGGYVPKDSAGDADYVVHLWGDDDAGTTAMVPYADGDEIRVPGTMAFGSEGMHTVNVEVIDGAGTRARDTDTVEIRPPECVGGDIDECLDVAPVTVTRTSGDWTIYKIEDLGHGSEAFCGRPNSASVDYTVGHFELWLIGTEGWLQKALDTKADRDLHLGQWHLSVCEYGRTMLYEVTIIERGVNQEWAEQRFAQIAARLEARGYSEWLNRFFPNGWLWHHPDHGTVHTTTAGAIRGNSW